MLRDLLDSLRCPRDHEESWLVAMVHRAEGPVLLEADISCPVCGAEFLIHEGIATFDAPVTAVERATDVVNDPTPLDATRIAALLGVVEQATPILLAGRYTRVGAELARMVSAPQLWVNAPANASVPHLSVSRLRTRERIPLGVHTVAAAAVDEVHAHDSMLDSVVRAVRVGGRVVAPASVPVPASLRELARDEHEWVAEVTTRASGLIELRRRAPDQVG